MEAHDRYLTIADICLQLRVHPKTLLRWRRAGQFPPPIELAPGSLRWRESHVQEWVDSRAELGAARDTGMRQKVHR